MGCNYISEEINLYLLAIACVALLFPVITLLARAMCRRTPLSSRAQLNGSVREREDVNTEMGVLFVLGRILCSGVVVVCNVGR